MVLTLIGWAECHTEVLLTVVQHSLCHLTCIIIKEVKMKQMVQIIFFSNQLALLAGMKGINPFAEYKSV